MTHRKNRELFARIFRYYTAKYKSKSPYGVTAAGAWATSRPVFIFSFFKKLNLAKESLFIDLGCGDGIVVAVAALFTKAVGIERDPQLAKEASDAFAALNLKRASAVCGDFYDHKIEMAEVLYIYPDKPLSRLFNRLKDKEWQGKLWVYGPHFPPPFPLPAKRLVLGKDTLTIYSFSTSPSQQ